MHKIYWKDQLLILNLTFLSFDNRFHILCKMRNRKSLLMRKYSQYDFIHFYFSAFNLPIVKYTFFLLEKIFSLILFLHSRKRLKRKIISQILLQDLSNIYFKAILILLFKRFVFYVSCISKEKEIISLKINQLQCQRDVRNTCNII